MRRPIGIIAVTLYFFSIGILTILRDLIYRHSFPYMFWSSIIFDIGFLLIGFGLFRLWEWARFAAMLVIFVTVGLTMPFLFTRVTQINGWLFLMVAMYIAHLYLVWYLFRSATAKYFSPMLKTA